MSQNIRGGRGRPALATPPPNLLAPRRQPDRAPPTATTSTPQRRTTTGDGTITTPETRIESPAAGGSVSCGAQWRISRAREIRVRVANAVWKRAGPPAERQQLQGHRQGTEDSTRRRGVVRGRPPATNRKSM
jgi:hypothetical protein